jgi:hypothetical protein
MCAMDGQTRRDVLKVAGVAGAAALLSGGDARAESASEIVSHRSTTGVIVPPRGASFMKFSFDTPSRRCGSPASMSASRSSRARTPIISTSTSCGSSRSTAGSG